MLSAVICMCFFILGLLAGGLLKELTYSMTPTAAQEELLVTNDDLLVENQKLREQSDGQAEQLLGLTLARDQFEAHVKELANRCADQDSQLLEEIRIREQNDTKIAELESKLESLASQFAVKDMQLCRKIEVCDQQHASVVELTAKVESLTRTAEAAYKVRDREQAKAGALAMKLDRIKWVIQSNGEGAAQATATS